ncbi:hypothetical protein V6Z11_A08G086800 [Gossypium hirsutum]
MELDSHSLISPKLSLDINAPHITTHISEYSQSYGMLTISNSLMKSQGQNIHSVIQYYLPIIRTYSPHNHIISTLYTQSHGMNNIHSYLPSQQLSQNDNISSHHNPLYHNSQTYLSHI